MPSGVDPFLFALRLVEVGSYFVSALSLASIAIRFRGRK